MPKEDDPNQGTRLPPMSSGSLDTILIEEADDETSSSGSITQIKPSEVVINVSNLENWMYLIKLVYAVICKNKSKYYYLTYNIIWHDN